MGENSEHDYWLYSYLTKSHSDYPDMKHVRGVKVPKGTPMQNVLDYANPPKGAFDLDVYGRITEDEYEEFY